MSLVDDGLEHDELRERILQGAAKLIAEGGRDAVTTRAVAAAAAVQAPTIYRLFGDKRGLLDAVAEHALAAYVAKKSKVRPDPDPIADLRRGWDEYVAFGVSNPGVFAVMAGEPRPGAASPAMAAGLAVLRARIKRVAASGRLRVSAERAAALLHAAGTGVVQTLLAEPETERDLSISDLAREAVLGAITGKPRGPAVTGVQGAASALRAALDETRAISPGERLLLEELLTRIAETRT